MRPSYFRISNRTKARVCALGKRVFRRRVSSEKFEGTVFPTQRA